MPLFTGIRTFQKFMHHIHIIIISFQLTQVFYFFTLPQSFTQPNSFLKVMDARSHFFQAVRIRLVKIVLKQLVKIVRKRLVKIVCKRLVKIVCKRLVKIVYERLVEIFSLIYKIQLVNGMFSSPIAACGAQKPNLNFGKLPLGKWHIWEVASWKNVSWDISHP